MAYVDPNEVARVYSGRPGCACGCRGNYSTNPTTIKQICKKISALEPHPYGGNNFIAATHPDNSRTYTAYFKKGNLAKDVRSRHRGGDNSDRRVRLHRALDAVMDRAAARDSFAEQKTTSYKGFTLSYASQHEPVVVKKDGKKVYMGKNLEDAKAYCTKNAY
jgi:hypothetical protein